MKTLKLILNWLSGKKSIIVGVIMTVVSYLAAKGMIGELEVGLIGGLVTVLFGTTSYLTGKYIYDK